MLQRIRDNASGPLAYAVVALISLVFGVWGIGSYFTDSPNPAVAQVGDTEITKYELQQAYDQRYQRLQQLMGENFDHDMIQPDRFRRDVLNGMIERAALAQYADDKGYRVTDQVLLDALRDNRRFQVDGEFSAERYRAILAQARVSPGAYENNLRDDLQLQQVRDAVLETSFVTQRDVGFEYRIENQRRKLAWLSFDADDFRDEVEVSDADIETFYEDQQQAFMTPERIKLAYVSVDRNELDVAEEPAEKFLRAIYDQEKDARFKTPERRKARHILVRIDDDTDADAARKKIQELAGQLDSGADFAELAREHSDDSRSAEKGGQLDWVTRGTMVKGFEDALFDMQPGSVSRPVRTDFGWHLIKLEDVEASQVKPFDDPEVQAELLDTYRSQERDERYRQLTQRLDSLSFEAPDSLEPLADELDMDIRESGWITRQGEARDREEDRGLGQYEAVRQAAFSDSVLKDGLNSTPIQLSGDRQVVVRVAEHEQANRKPLEAVSDDIRQRLIDQKAHKQARAAAEQALAALRGGKSLEAVAGDRAQTHEAQWIDRNSDTLSPRLREAAFSLAQPEDGKTTYGLGAASDRIAVFALTAIDEPAPADKDVVDAEKVGRELRGRIAGLEFSAFREQLLEDTSVEINEDRIN